VKAMRAFSSESAEAVMDLLRTKGITFRGPFHTPGKHVVFVVENYIFLESELIDLSRQHMLHQEGIQELSHHIKVHSR
jgi:hypothetical protein